MWPKHRLPEHAVRLKPLRTVAGCSQRCGDNTSSFLRLRHQQLMMMSCFSGGLEMKSGDDSQGLKTSFIGRSMWLRGHCLPKVWFSLPVIWNWDCTYPHWLKPVLHKKLPVSFFFLFHLQPAVLSVWGYLAKPMEQRNMLTKSSQKETSFASPPS